MPDTPAATRTVLVVDDEAGVRDVLRRVLQNEGYRVIDARDGADGLRLAEAEAGPIDLLLTDFKMPKMDGRELAERLRARQPDLKVLFLTAFPDKLFADRSLLENNTAFLEKPISSRGLLEAVRLLLFGTVAGGESGGRPLDELLTATNETEYLRIPLGDGGWARLLFTGADPSIADLEEVMHALVRQLNAARESQS